ncbi:hypothetical protein IMZ48_13315 [Candidatus Bathyarchaeota archaeon]|nr:hypothetical protein [Candidatus Bathyarchaeota archaeon]
MKFQLCLLGVLLAVLSPACARPKKCDYRTRNFNTICSIYDLTVYPNQVPIITGGATKVPDGLFSHDVVGRVYPVGNFKGFEDSIEYFFALAPLPQMNTKSAAITSYKITSFSSGCPNVAASVVHLYTSVVDPKSPDHGKALAPIKQVSSTRRTTYLSSKLTLDLRSLSGGSMIRVPSSNTTPRSRVSTSGPSSSTASQ